MVSQVLWDLHLQRVRSIFRTWCHRRRIWYLTSTAPPPATTVWCFLALLVIMMASWIDLSASSTKCSLQRVSFIPMKPSQNLEIFTKKWDRHENLRRCRTHPPPLRRMVAVRDCLASKKKLYLALPTCLSSKSPQVPRISGIKLVTVVCTWDFSQKILSPTSPREHQVTWSHLSTGGFADSSQVFILNSSCSENSSVGKVLSGKISNSEARQDNVGARFHDTVQFVVYDGPLGVYNRLVLLKKKSVLEEFSKKKLAGKVVGKTWRIFWENYGGELTSGFSIRISALSFSDFNSSSMFKAMILGSVNFFGCCSKPA